MSGTATGHAIYSDGAARGNPGPAGAGGIIINNVGEIISEVSEYLGEQTNNAAEYLALILTLERACELGFDQIRIFADSELLVKQLRGEYRVKNAGLIPLHRRARELINALSVTSMEHIPREQNSAADCLANDAIDGYQSGDKEVISIDGTKGQTSLF